MNPYLIGSTMWYDIEDRWNKGRFGEEYEEEPDMEKKKNWDTGVMRGHEKVLKTLRTCNDWFFMQNFLTNDLVSELELYIYVLKKDFYSQKIVVTDNQKKEIKKLIIKSFAHSGIPRIQVQEGKRELHLEHKWVGVDLDPTYTQKTIEHVAYLWGENVHLHTKIDGVPKTYTVNYEELPEVATDE
jgi:stage V sporulation protein R